MRNINLRYVDEAYDENGLLTKFDITMPDNFNFAYDVVDDIAINDPERTAMVWCNPEGEEHTFTFADMKTWSDKTANFLADCGIGRGDFVMVILRRHYQFWFVATALAKLGAVMVPATFMLKEHDLEYRLNGEELCNPLLPFWGISGIEDDEIFFLLLPVLSAYQDEYQDVTAYLRERLGHLQLPEELPGRIAGRRRRT